MNAMNTKKQARELFWERWKAVLKGHLNTFDAAREYLEWYFTDAERIKLFENPADLDGYLRRPVIGLRLRLPGEKVLAIRPDWTPPSTSRDKGQVLGKLHPGVISLELLGPGKLLRLRLREAAKDGKPVETVSTVGGLFSDEGKNRTNLGIVVGTLHDLLTKPAELFARQADHCVCCSRSLTGALSRNRGIGPECIRMFNTFQIAPPTAVEKYRQKYLADTGFLPGR